jgi:hypothetical protein
VTRLLYAGATLTPPALTIRAAAPDPAYTIQSSAPPATTVAGATDLAYTFTCADAYTNPVHCDLALVMTWDRFTDSHGVSVAADPLFLPQCSVDATSGVMVCSFLAPTLVSGSPYQLAPKVGGKVFSLMGLIITPAASVPAMASLLSEPSVLAAGSVGTIDVVCHDQYGNPLTCPAAVGSFTAHTDSTGTAHHMTNAPHCFVDSVVGWARCTFDALTVVANNPQTYTFVLNGYTYPPHQYTLYPAPFVATNTRVTSFSTPVTAGTYGGIDFVCSDAFAVRPTSLPTPPTPPSSWSLIACQHRSLSSRMLFPALQLSP